MKIRTLALTAAVLASATGYAFAQTNSGTMTPTEHAGSKAQDSSMSNGAMNKDSMKSGTTGAGMTRSDTSGKSDTPQTNKNVSPASPNAGVKQER